MKNSIAPAFISDVALEPLLGIDGPPHRQRIAVVADLCEIPLPPSAAVDEGYPIGGELCDIVVLRSRTMVASQFVDEDEHEQLLTWMGLEHPQDC